MSAWGGPKRVSHERARACVEKLRPLPTGTQFAAPSALGWGEGGRPPLVLGVYNHLRDQVEVIFGHATRGADCDEPRRAHVGGCLREGELRRARLPGSRCWLGRKAMGSLHRTLETVPAAGRCAVAALSVAAAILAMPATARGDNIFETNNSSGTIGEYTDSGATVNPSLITGLGSFGPFGIAVSGSNLFVTNAGGTIGEYTTSGATVNPSLISGFGLPLGIAVSGSNLFVTNYFSGTIGQYTTSGATVNPSLISGLSLPIGIAVSGSNLFVVNSNSNTIGEYTTSGATVNPSLISGLILPAGIAVSGSNLFVTNAGSGTIGEYTTSGATVNALLISGLANPYGIAVVPVPEPATGLLVMAGVMGLAVSRRRTGVSA